MRCCLASPSKVAALLVAFFMEGCDRAPPMLRPGAKTFTDGLGRSVAIALPARRIVSIAPSNTEILFAIGAGPLVAGRDDFSDYPADAIEARKVGSGASLDLEAVVGLRPDLVLTAEITSPEQVRSIEKLGLTAFFLPNPKTFDGLFQNIRLAGEITGRSDAAERLATSLAARVKAVEERLRGAKGRPRVFYELDATDPSQPWTAGQGTFLDMLITLSGGANFAESQAQPFPRLSAEKLIRDDPDIIILGDSMAGVTVESVRERAGWGSLSAVKQGKVYPFDDSLASRPGPRLVDGLETLARLLHPEVFDAR